MARYNESISIDKVAYKQGILGSIAFARVNQKGSIFAADELQKMEWGFQAVIKEWGDGSFKTVPGVDEEYTYFRHPQGQRAQPVRWGHMLLPHALIFASNLERLGEVVKRVNRSPLGCGTLAGNPSGLDRDMMASELGFERLL
ncbi:hypothetical protein ANO14919_052980 [Xylariales sp. No.14919]|nr:hypothetical protein ANO14919_052980 [Xylariales sp. No.14919]